METPMRPGDVVVKAETTYGTCAACGSEMQIEYDDVAGRRYITSTRCPVDYGHWRANVDAYVAGDLSAGGTR